MRSFIYLALVGVGLLFPAETIADTDEIALLRSQINLSLRDGHQRISYSAAYDALANIFEDPENPDNVILFYTNRSQLKTLRVGVDGRDGWNREHLWPQSRGAENVPARSDLYLLRPTDATVNSRRGNLDFDEGGNPEGEAPGTFFDTNSFEPRDGIKGDVARAAFYVDVRYEGNGNEPDLVLVDIPTGRGTAMGQLCTLLDWHIQDPPDALELQVNDAIETLQGNRNIFVDQPELANTIYAARCGLEDIQPRDGLIAQANLTAPSDFDGLVRVATWNIANFWHVDGEHLRPRRDGSTGLVRDAEDYAAIRDVAATLDADIIGLQEMGSPDGVRTLFPESDWEMVFSRRLADDLLENPDKLSSDENRDIYTALVIRRDVATVLGTERIELDIRDSNGFPVREGTAALIDIDGFQFWAASIHLKSGCFTDNDLSEREACQMLARQIPILEDWIDRKSSQGQAVVLLGDFNRQLDRGIDQVRADLDDDDPVELFKLPHRQELVCEAFRPGPQVSIDYVIFNELLWENVRVPETPKFDFSDPKISDHCPVFADIAVSN